MDLSNAVITSAGGYRESTDLWLTVVTGPATRGVRALAATIGDGAIGLLLDRQTRGLTQDVGTAMQGHYIANVLDTLPYQVRVSGHMGFKKTVHAARFAA